MAKTMQCSRGHSFTAEQAKVADYFLACGCPATSEEGRQYAGLESVRDLERRCGAIPLCPECNSQLIARRPDERFMEANHYAECLRGHVFELVPTDKLPKGKTALEAIQSLVTGTDPGKIQSEIARLFLEGRLYAGFEQPDGMKFEQVTPPETN